MSATKNESGVTPLRYGLIVEPVKVEEKTAGGIYLPDEGKERQQWRQTRGRVVALGELAFTMGTPGSGGFFEDKVRPQVGDLVAYREYQGQNFYAADNKTRFVMLQDSEVLGIVND